MSEQKTIEIVITDVEPMGCVRMTRRGKFKNPSAQKYLAFKDYLRLKMKQQYKDKPIANRVYVDMTFFMPIRKSETKKNKIALIGKFHAKKPDLDNLIKSLFDAANGVIWLDDNQVCSIRAKKVYSETPGIEFEVIEIV